MTFSARAIDRPGPGERFAQVQVTSGPVTIVVEEPVSYLRSFWAELGRVLEHAEKESQ